MVDETYPPIPPAVPLVRGPVLRGWQECTLTRATELESLLNWALLENPGAKSQSFGRTIGVHLESARQAAVRAKTSSPPAWWWGAIQLGIRGQALRERAISNLDAASSELIHILPSGYLVGQIPSLLEHVRCHLVETDTRRQDFERIAKRLGVINKKGVNNKKGEPCAANPERVCLQEVIEEERPAIASITGAASSAALREQIRVRSFRNVVVWVTVVMWILVSVVALVGAFWPTAIPLCFAPQMQGQIVIVCPTEQSVAFAAGRPPAELWKDIDEFVAVTVSRGDLAVVELIGMIAAAVAAAGAIRKLRGSSERYGLPVALAALKLPTGAITAVLGLLLLRGQFVPGLSALDTSAQILAWALVFGYAQQLFTRFVDQQGQTVLNSVRSADPKNRPDPDSKSPTAGRPSS